nr:hypothetical protein [Tanacetum cinerariifolium]
PIYIAEGLLLERQKTQSDVAVMIVEAIQKEHENFRAEIKFKKITTTTACRTSAIRPRDHDDYQDDDAHHEGENSTKRHKVSEHETYSLGESSSGQAMEQEPNPLGSIPDDKVSQELLEEMPGEIDEAKLQRAVDEMLRQRCNLREEHQ